MGSDFHNSYHWVCCCWRWWILSHITSVRIHFIGCCRHCFTIYTWSHFCFFTFRWFVIFFITGCERNWCFFNFRFRTDFNHTSNRVCCCWRWWIFSNHASIWIYLISGCRNSFTIYTWSHFCFFTFRWFVIFFITGCKRNWCFFNFRFCSDFVNIIFLVDMVPFINMNFVITVQYYWAVIINNVVFSILVDSKRFTSNDNIITIVNLTATFFIFTIWIVFPYSWFIVTVLGIIRKSRINNMRIFRIYFASIWDNFTIMFFTSMTVVHRFWIFVFFVNLTIAIFIIQFCKQFFRLIVRKIVFTWYNKTSPVITRVYEFWCLIATFIISNVFLTFWNNHFITFVRRR